jgi:hypothetical protein
MGKFLAGAVFGLVLSVCYVWYGVTLPGWMELPVLFQKSLKAAAVDDALFDPDVPDAMRRRALEVYFENQAKRAAALEAELGYPLTRELRFRRAKRAAQILRAQWSGYDAALEKPALRKTLLARHGVADNDNLKRRMLMAALRKKPALLQWFKLQSRTPSEVNVLEVLTELSQSRRAPPQ